MYWIKLCAAKNIRSVNVNNMSVTVDGGKIKEYRVNLHLSFELE